MFKKAISHIHTRHSFDCLVRPEKIVDYAVSIGVDYLVITDHDTLAGSIEAAAYAARKGYSISVPIGAEYNTDIGDVIVTNVQPDFPFHTDHRILCRQAKEQGGYTIIPHPYKGHKLDKIDFSLIDCIEVYNARCTFEENMKAYGLAHQLNKHRVYGSDAHTFADIANALYGYLGPHPFDGQTEPLRLMPTPWQHNELSRFVRGVKLRKPKEALRAIKRSLIAAGRQMTGKDLPK